MILCKADRIPFLKKLNLRIWWEYEISFDIKARSQAIYESNLYASSIFLEDR